MKKLRTLSFAVLLTVIATSFFINCSGNDDFDELKVGEVTTPVTSGTEGTGSDTGTNPPPGGR